MPASGSGMLDRADEVAQHVADRDRLAPGVHPLRRDHHRQHLGEVAQHLEARRARADDHRGAQLDRLDRARGEHLADVVPAAQVVAELGVVVAEPAEVHDATDAGGLGRAPEVLGDRPLARHPVGAVADAVHEEHRDVDVGHRLGEVTGDVGPDDLDVVRATRPRRASADRGRGTRTVWPAARSSGTSRPPT